MPTEFKVLETLDVFDSVFWQHKIEKTVQRIGARDNGGLAWCRQNHPLLYRKAIGAGKAVDRAFSAQDAEGLGKALNEVVNTHLAAFRAKEGDRHDP